MSNKNDRQKILESHRIRGYRLLTLIKRLCEACSVKNCGITIKKLKTMEDSIKTAKNITQLLLIKQEIINHIKREELLLSTIIGEDKVKEIHDIWVTENKILLKEEMFL